MKLMIVSAGILGAVLIPGIVFAEHDEPERARGISSSLVKTYEPCTRPNTTIGRFRLPACSPPVPSDTKCGIDGRGEISAQVLKNSDIRIRVNVTGLTNCEGEQLRSSAAIQATSHNCAGEEKCTSVILATDIGQGSDRATCVVRSGRCVIDTTVNTALGAETVQAANEAGVEILDCGMDRITSEGVPIFPVIPTLSCGLLAVGDRHLDRNEDSDSDSDSDSD